jgi:hypothetical protein
MVGLAVRDDRAWLELRGSTSESPVLYWHHGVQLADNRIAGRTAPSAHGGVVVSGGRAWSLTDGLAEVDLTTGKTVRERSAAELYPGTADPSPAYVSVSGGTAFVLGLGSDGSWLAALDLGSGTLRWGREVDPAGPGGYGPGRNTWLATHDGEAFLVMRAYRSPEYRVYRLDADGRLLARTKVLGPMDPWDANIVATSSGVYLSLRHGEAKGDHGAAEVLRLDRQRLGLKDHVVLRGYAQLDQGPTGLWSTAITCDRELLSRLDPVTLEPLVTYEVHPDNHEAHWFDVTGERVVVAYQETFESDHVVVESYSGL